MQALPDQGQIPDIQKTGAQKVTTKSEIGGGMEKFKVTRVSGGVVSSLREFWDEAPAEKVFGSLFRKDFLDLLRRL